MARALVSLSDLKTKYKGAGVFTIISDESVTTYNAPGRMSVLVPGFSKIGWYNRPFLIDAGDVETARNLYGERDKSLERKGSFFHKSIDILLKTSPVIALNLMKFNDTIRENGTPSNEADVVDFLSLSTYRTDTNSHKGSALYSSFFKKDDWFIPSTEQLLANSPEWSIINFVNLLQQKLSFVVRKVKLDGYDMELKEWYSGDVPEYLDPHSNVNDYMVEVIAIVGDFTQRGSHELVKDGGIIDADKFEKFLERQDVITKFRVVGSLIPDFKTRNGENLFIERMINSSTISHGVVCAVNREKIENTYDVLLGSGWDISGSQVLSHIYTESNTSHEIELSEFKDDDILERVDMSEFERVDMHTLLLRKNDTSETYKKLRTFLIGTKNPIARIARKSEWNLPSELQSRQSFYESVLKLCNYNADVFSNDLSIKVLENGDIEITTSVHSALFETSDMSFVVTPNENAVFMDGSPANTIDNVIYYFYGKGYNARKDLSESNKIIVTRKLGTINGNINTSVVESGARNDDFDTYDRSSGERQESSLVINRASDDHSDGKCYISVLKNRYTYVYDDVTKSLCFPHGYFETSKNGVKYGVKTDIATSYGYGDPKKYYGHYLTTSTYIIANDGNVNSRCEYFSVAISKNNSYGASGNVTERMTRMVIGSDSEKRDIPNILDIFDKDTITVEEMEFLKIFYDDISFNTRNRTSIAIDNRYGYKTNKIVMTEDDYKNSGFVAGYTFNVEYVNESVRVNSVSQKIVGYNKYYVLELDSSVSLRDLRKEFDLYKSTVSYQIFCLRGFQVKPQAVPDGSNRSIKDLYSVITDTNMVKALSDPEAISFRYIVDTFNGGIEPKCKSYFSQIAKRRDTCLAIINMPRTDEFRKHRNPRFTDSPTNENPSPSLDIKYIIDGGNKLESPDWFFSLPDEEQGASHSAFFFPNISVVENDGSVSSIPPAAYVASCFMRKFGTEDEYKPSAGLIRGLISGDGVSGTDYRLDTDDYRSLIEYGVNPIIMKNGVPIIYGNETGYQRFTSALNNIHARDLLISIADETRRLVEPYVFDYNDDTMRSTIRTILNGYYGALRDAYRAIESFKITIDRTNNPGWMIDNDGVLIDIEIVITGVAKKFINRITLKGRSANQTGFTVI